MKTIVITIIMFVSVFIGKSQNNTLTPEKGNIIFQKRVEIYNKQALDSSFFHLLKRKTDYTTANMIVQPFDNESEEDARISMKSLYETICTNQFYTTYHKNPLVHGIEYSFNFKDSIIVVQSTMRDKLIDDYFINRNNNKIRFRKVDNAIKRVKNNTPYSYSTTYKNLTEYRDQTKNINNYKCFKIVYEEEHKDDSGFSETFYYESYVTESIKCNYHPIIKNRKILQRYYPLEFIIEKENIVGAREKYMIKELYLE